MYQISDAFTTREKALLRDYFKSVHNTIVHANKEGDFATVLFLSNDLLIKASFCVLESSDVVFEMENTRQLIMILR